MLKYLPIFRAYAFLSRRQLLEISCHLELVLRHICRSRWAFPANRRRIPQTSGLQGFPAPPPSFSYSHPRPVLPTRTIQFPSIANLPTGSCRGLLRIDCGGAQGQPQVGRCRQKFHVVSREDARFGGDDARHPEGCCCPELAIGGQPGLAAGSPFIEGSLDGSATRGGSGGELDPRWWGGIPCSTPARLPVKYCIRRCHCYQGQVHTQRGDHRRRRR